MEGGGSGKGRGTKQAGITFTLACFLWEAFAIVSDFSAKKIDRTKKGGVRQRGGERLRERGLSMHHSLAALEKGRRRIAIRGVLPLSLKPRA